MSNDYVRILTQTTRKPQLEQRSSPALNIFSLPPCYYHCPYHGSHLALVRETEGYKDFVVIFSLLSDQGTTETNAIFSRPFTGLAARLPY